MLKPSVYIAAVVALVVAVTAVAFAQDDGTQSPADGTAAVLAVEHAAEVAMTDSLGRSRQQGDALPADIARAVREHPKFGMNADLSRRLVANARNTLYVLPGSGHVCVALTVAEGATFGCPTTDAIARGEVGASTVTLEEGAIGIYGLVPDGVNAITLKTGTAGSASVPVTDNGYYTAVPAGTALRSISYIGPSGAVEFPIYDPASVFDE
jgi:hypothetical protein